ncbi:MAG TPA: thioredoxin family protein, partial [Oculatellaceae cyanobacterium]
MKNAIRSESHKMPSKRAFGGKIAKLLSVGLGVSLLLSSAAAPAAALPNRPAEFDDEAAGKFLLLDFYTPYCGTCQMMKPYVQALQNKTQGKMNVAHVDVSQPPNRKYISMFGISGTPTYVLFNPAGKAVYK